MGRAWRQTAGGPRIGPDVHISRTIRQSSWSRTAGIDGSGGSGVVSYIPAVFCAKCGKSVPGAQVKRRLAGARGNAQERFVEVSCHGEVTRVAFVDAPGQEVTAWSQ
jgi:hypothetical protein